MRIRGRIAGVLFLTLPAVASLVAASDIRGPLKDIAFIPAVTANEGDLTAKIATLLPEVITTEVDNLGALYARVGRGSPSLAVITGADEFGYVVSTITPDGFLRLDRGVPPPLALSDTFLLGRSVVIRTGSGTVAGVVSQPALHLMTADSRDRFAKPLGLDLVYVDIGARSADEVKARGIRILDPVTWTPTLSELAKDRRAGPGLGRRAACAALAAAAQDLGTLGSASVELAWMAQSRVLVRGAKPSSLGALRARNRLAAKSVIVLDSVPAGQAAGGPRLGGGLVIIKAQAGESRLAAALETAAAALHLSIVQQTVADSPLLQPFLGPGGDAVILALPVRYAGTPSEVVDLKDVQAAADLIVELMKKGGLS